jgi:hypothetical protein
VFQNIRSSLRKGVDAFLGEKLPTILLDAVSFIITVLCCCSFSVVLGGLVLSAPTSAQKRKEDTFRYTFSESHSIHIQDNAK